MLSRKGRFLHQEPNKTGFSFFLILLRFLMKFLRFSLNPNVQLHRDPWLKFQNHTNTLGFQNEPWKFLASCNVVPGRACSSPVAESPAGDGRTWPEELSRTATNIDRGGFWPWKGWERCRQWPAAWPASGVRRGSACTVPAPSGRLVLTVYFGTPSMFITLWFGIDYGTNPPLGTLIM
jgi:hypothetical protein